jgi:hypothetical protein
VSLTIEGDRVTIIGRAAFRTDRASQTDCMNDDSVFEASSNTNQGYRDAVIRRMTGSIVAVPI